MTSCAVIRVTGKLEAETQARERCYACSGIGTERRLGIIHQAHSMAFRLDEIVVQL